MATFPRFSCICGSNVVVLKRQFANYSNMQLVSCHCNQYYKNVDNSTCPSPGCNDFIAFLKMYYREHVTASNMLPDD